MNICHVTMVSCCETLINFCKNYYDLLIYETPELFCKEMENLDTKNQVLIYDNTILKLSPFQQQIFKSFTGFKICIVYPRESSDNSLKEIYDIIITSPGNKDFLNSSIKNSLTRIEQIPEPHDNFFNWHLLEQLPKPSSILGFFVGHSTLISLLHAKIKEAAKNSLPSLLLGETGTGKSCAAEIIHKLSQRAKKPFKRLDFSGVVGSISESTLFGTVAHAFTDASETEGFFDLAQHGTLFLDEICNGTLKTQANLLTPIANQEKYKVGSTKIDKLDVRVICATNADIKEKIKEGSFREDLYHRINYNTIIFPPLRSHLEDIIPMIEDYFKDSPLEFSDNALDLLFNHKWPGNLREFYDCLSKIKTRCKGRIVLPEDFIEDLKK